MRTAQCHMFASGCVISFALFGCAPNEPQSGKIANGTIVANDKKSALHVDADSPESGAKEWVGKPSPALIEVLVHPDQYQDKEVLVAGYLRVEFEGDALYLDEIDDHYVRTSNAFALSFQDNALQMSREEIAEQFNERYVLLEGTFDKNDHGHMGMFRGAFKHIKRIDLEKSRSDYRRLKEEFRGNRIEQNQRESGG